MDNMTKTIFVPVRFSEGMPEDKTKEYNCTWFNKDTPIRSHIYYSNHGRCWVICGIDAYRTMNVSYAENKSYWLKEIPDPRPEMQTEIAVLKRQIEVKDNFIIESGIRFEAKVAELENSLSWYSSKDNIK
jgi:hypothetical protein